jgi:DNA-directed RNA polymerase specialized sigma24 family protein
VVRLVKRFVNSCIHILADCQDYRIIWLRHGQGGRRRYTPHDQSTAARTRPPQEDPPTSLSHAPGDIREADLLRAAFREVHGAGLHGFALLIALGDRSLAASIAATALANGVAHVAELRHPERAAAWLRSRVLRAARRSQQSHLDSREERDAALTGLGVPKAAIASLHRLTLEDRAAIVASSVEGFAMVDVAAILGRDLETTRRILRSARQRYLAAATHWLADSPGETPSGGVISARVDGAARRAIGPRSVADRA